MIRLTLICFAMLMVRNGFAQSHTVSLGVSTGLTTAYSWNQGINKDSRFRERYDMKWAPVSLQYSMDFDGLGFLISPGLINIGQNYYMINTSGGQVGRRLGNLRYFTLPVLFKVHLIDLSFFNVSFVSGASVGFLISGKESLSVRSSKLKFPNEVYPILPIDYDSVYDGVIVPDINNLTLLRKKDFSPVQIFAVAGLQTDWNLSNELKFTLGFQLQYGFFDPRTDAYLKEVKNFNTLYDIPGKRRDMFVQINIGISRFVEVEKKDKTKKRLDKSSSPKRNQWPKPRKANPKG